MARCNLFSRTAWYRSGTGLEQTVQLICSKSKKFLNAKLKSLVFIFIYRLLIFKACFILFLLINLFYLYKYSRGNLENFNI